MGELLGTDDLVAAMNESNAVSGDMEVCLRDAGVDEEAVAEFAARLFGPESPSVLAVMTAAFAAGIDLGMRMHRAYNAGRSYPTPDPGAFERIWPVKPADPTRQDGT